MARLGFEYKVDTDTDKQGGGGGLLPHMYARIQVESATQSETDDQKGIKVDFTFEVMEPVEFAGRKFWGDWTVAHADGYQHGRYKYGKPMLDRLVRATGNDPDEFSQDPDTDHLMFKSFVVEIGINIGAPNKTKPGEFYKDKNQIERFYFEDSGATMPVPELGVIGDGTQGKKPNSASSPTPANDNRPAARAANDNAPAAAKPAGAKPWGKRA